MGLLALIVGVVAAQTLPTLPPDEPLRQIEAGRFVIVYPASAEADAQHAANVLNAVAPARSSRALGSTPSRSSSCSTTSTRCRTAS